MTANSDIFGSRSTLELSDGQVTYYRLASLEEQGFTKIDLLPYSIRVLLESVLRKCDNYVVTEKDVRNLASWRPDLGELGQTEIPFNPARVVLQDFTGVPAVVDLAAMRSAMDRLGGDPQKINPLVPVDLVIDHSVQVDHFGRLDALDMNMETEFKRNAERYEFLRWGQQAFDNFRVVPPGMGIVHQVNLEYLAKVVCLREENGEQIAIPDSLVGTDSHTTMIDGLGVVGWGVGGIEAEGVMLGQPIYMLMPEVVGMEIVGELPTGATATDLVLTITQILRQEGVVGKFVEFFGSGMRTMSVADRATIANMAPEYGATMGFFPVDEATLAYLRKTGRTEQEVELVERYTKAQQLFHTDDSPAPKFTKTLKLDLATVEPCLAGPKRPQDRILLTDMQSQWQTDLAETYSKSPGATATATLAGTDLELTHGNVAIAAITSCTNTSNPSVMIAAGLLAKKAAAKGLQAAPHVKTSLAPGSRVVTEYLEASGLDQDLNSLGFATVGYGCTTCIGNSGPLPEPISKAIRQEDMVVAGVLSGNRNFEGRINPDVKANYLASPPLVVAYALAGTVDIDFESEPIGTDGSGQDVFLREIWPSADEVHDVMEQAVKPEMFTSQYDGIWDKNEKWNAIEVSGGDLYEWNEESTYIQEPPFLIDLAAEPGPIEPVDGARCLALLGDSVTTDHISPAGAIATQSPAGEYLIGRGVEPLDFNSYGSRRGNDRVMTRGTFANIRIRNQLAPGTEGGVTRHLPGGEEMSIYDAAMKYKEAGVPLVVIAGSEYGTGSSRDWAAKGTFLLGVRAVLATSYERIHRSNLVGMGVLPLEFKAGTTWQSLGLTGEETFDIPISNDSLSPGQELNVTATTADGSSQSFPMKVRIDTPVELDYYRNGGILHTVLRKLNS